jgi:hypothetical protein
LLVASKALRQGGTEMTEAQLVNLKLSWLLLQFFICLTPMSNLPRQLWWESLAATVQPFCDGMAGYLSFHFTTLHGPKEAHSLLLIICFFTILIYIQHLDQDSLDILVSVGGKKDDWMNFFVELSHNLLWLPLEYLCIFLLTFTQFWC